MTQTPADSLQQPSPWDALDDEGSGLAVTDFLTTTVITAGAALRRTVTLAYTGKFGLTMAEWRMLSVLAHARELPFAELVIRSATDKAQVSRTLRVMEGRGLMGVRAEGNPPRRKLTCVVTPAGLALYNQVMPVARREQAAMIRHLSKAERRALYGALRKLRALCGPAAVDAE
jgi:DNA-binding MarR family transcriptional regulator